MFFQSSEDVGSRVQKMLVPEVRRCWFQSSEDVCSRVQKRRGLLLSVYYRLSTIVKTKMCC